MAATPDTLTIPVNITMTVEAGGLRVPFNLYDEDIVERLAKIAEVGAIVSAARAADLPPVVIEAIAMAAASSRDLVMT